MRPNSGHQAIAVCQACGNYRFNIRLYSCGGYVMVCNDCTEAWTAPDWCIPTFHGKAEAMVEGGNEPDDMVSKTKREKKLKQIDSNLQYPGKDPDFVFPEEEN